MDLAIVDTRSGDPIRRPLALPLFPLGLFTLWDMYAAGVRVFDLLAFPFLFGAVALQSMRSFRTASSQFLLLALLFVLLWSILGISSADDAVKPAVGLILGIFTAILIAAARWEPGNVLRFIKLLIIVHAIAMLAQAATFMLTGVILNYHGWLGLTPRVNWLVIRAAGLFQEPAHFCLMMFSLIVLHRLVSSRKHVIEVFGLCVMLASLSLWGIAACAVFITVFRSRWLAVIIPLAAIALTYIFALIRNDNPVWALTIGRLTALGTDRSANVRYGGILDGHENLWDWSFWFGKGISNDYLATGSSSISFVLNAVGLVGLGLTILFWISILPPARRFGGTVALTFMLSAASQWTWLWWWAWLGLAVSVPMAAPRRVAI